MKTSAKRRVNRADQTAQEHSAVEFLDFSLTLENIEVLRNIDFKVTAGNFTVVYGCRGAGKSALLRSLLGLNKEIYENVSYKGSIKINNKDISSYEKKILRKIVTYIEPTFLEALDYLTFNEYMNLIADEESISIDNFSTELDRLGILKLLRKEMKTPLRDFYTMEKVMILIFSAVVRKSSVVVLDCILDHVDDEALERISQELFTMKEDRVVILSTRHKSRFLSMANLFIHLKNGRIEYSGNPRDLVIKG